MKILVVFFLLVNLIYAKKDFYYSFINSSGNQISQEKKQAVSDGFEIIENVNRLSKEGKIDDAFKQIEKLKEENNLKVLQSDIVVNYSELALKKNNRRIIVQAEETLENALKSSIINEYNLPKAYALLVELKTYLNKIDEAKYFANTIINSFDDELSKTKGKIQLAKIYKRSKNYGKAIRILYDILAKTKDKEIATIVADELFDVYLLNSQEKKAQELISKVLKTNIDYYADDSYLANKKINRLIRANMPQYAAEILKELLNKATRDEAIEDFKYKLANTYMLMYDRTNFYLEKAKELYKDIIGDYSTGPYFKKSKMYLDEILMRQNVLKPSVVATKYNESASMEQKALLQELMNDKKDKKFEKILRTKKVYMKISDIIAKRFGYESMNTLFDEINIEMIETLLANEKCFELDKALKSSREETLKKLIDNETLKYKFFQCLIEVPYEKAYLKVKETFNLSRDANIYLYLERMAYSLKHYDEALNFSAKVEMVNNEEILLKEFLHRFKILKAKKDSLLLEKFFIYANKNPQYIEKNSENPLIIDFFYDYYFYLLKKDKKEEALKILNALNNKQIEYKAYVYSPFVEMELAKIQKDNKNYDEELNYLLKAIKNTRRLKADDEIKIYYDILKLYEKKNDTEKMNEYILKCKEVKNPSSDNLYKKMCDEL